MLAITVVVGPQLIGGVFPWGVALITGAAGLACLAAAWTAHESATRAPVSPAGLVGIGAWLWTAAQVLPVPRPLTEWLQPEAVALSDGASALLGDAPRDWVALSMAPGSTVLQLVQGAGLLAAFIAAATMVALGHRRRALSAIGISGLAMATVALVHEAAGLERVFGIYAPIHTTSPLLAPLVNQNSLSGFLSMCAPVLVGLGLDQEEPPKRWGWITGGVVVATCALLAVSRGGVASLTVGFLALGIFGAVRRRRERGKATGSSLVLVGATFATAVGLGLYFAADALYRDFEQSGYEKLTLARLAFDLSLDHPWVGVGRGAFSAAFVSRLGTTTRVTHPENLLAQWITEWGFPVAVLLIVVLAAGIARATQRARSWAHLGGAAGLIAIFVHDLVDFSLELAGVGVVAAALTGTVLAPSRRNRPTASRLTIPRVGAAVGMVAAGIVLLLGWTLGRHSVDGMQRVLEEQLVGRDHHAFETTVVDAVRRHPSEPTFALLGGSEAAQRGDPDALRWLNRAMSLAPGWAAPHDEAARYLFRAGNPTQALLEIRQAGERDLPRSARNACPALEDHPELARAAIRIFGSDAVGDRLLDVVGSCLPSRSPSAAVIDRHLVERGVLGGRVRSARRALDAGEAREALAVLEGVESDERDLLQVRARAYLALDDPERALAVLARVDGSERWPLELRARAHAAALDEAAMLATLERWRGLSAGSARQIAAVWVLEGELQEQLGNDFAALRAYGRAERMDPRSAGLDRVARIAERIGDLGRAYRARGQLCERDGRRSASCRHRDRLLEELRESRRRAGQPVDARLD